MTDRIRIPTEIEITDAIEIVDQSFGERGGSWVVAMQPEIMSKHGSIERQKLASLASFTVGAEMILDGPILENPTPARRAMRFGLQAGLEVASVLYGGAIRSGPLTYGLKELIDTNKDHTDQDPIHDSITTVRALGNAGIALLDLQAESIVNGWSEVAIEKSYLRHLYTLGCGAILFTAQAIQKARLELQIDESSEEDVDIEALWQLPPHNEDTSE